MLSVLVVPSVIQRAGVAAALKGISLALGFAISISLARMLGPDGFGVYAFCFSVISICALPVGTSLNQFVMREVARAKKSGSEGLIKGLINRALYWIFCFGSLISILLIFLSDQFDKHLLLFALPLITLTALVVLFTEVIRGCGLVLQSQWPDMVMRPLIFLTSVWMLSSQSGLQSDTAMLAYTLAVFLTLLVLVLTFLKTVRTEAYRVSLPTFKIREWLGAIPWFMSNNAIGVFSVQLAFVILGYLSERVSEVGAFQLAVSFALFINLPLVIANLFLGPKIAGWWQAGELQANLKIVTRVTRVISLFSATGSVLLLTFSEVILGALYGEDFVFVADALQIMVVGQLINVVFGPAGLMLMACGFERQALLGRTLGTAISVMVTIVTVREWGAVGAAYGVTAGLLVWNVWMMIKLREHVRTPILFLLGR